MTFDELLKKHGVNVEIPGEVGEGWFKILAKAFRDLKKIGWDGQAAQIKEKFGGLRFYLPLASDAAEAIVRRAEEESFKVCARCGKPGKLHSRRGWMMTRCDGCIKKI